MPEPPVPGPARPIAAVERIVVFRALMLGDFLVAVPALRALRAAFPAAHIDWVGLEQTRGMAERLPHLLDGFIPFPGHPGLPEIEPDLPALDRFLVGMRHRKIDLALQMHGSGNIVNALVAQFGAARSAGFFDAAGPAPVADASRYAPWPTRGHEIERLLALTDHLGLARRGRALEFPLGADDRAALRAAWPGWPGRRSETAARGADPGSRYVVVHPGSQLASRRWPVARFAAVADRIAADGRRVVVSGSAGEAALAAALRAGMERPAVDLAGRTSLGALGALIEGADAIVCNDTSVSHIAAALGTPSVVVSCGADTARWSPLDRDRHRVLAAPVACRPCGHAACPVTAPVAHPCATAVGADTVAATLARLLDAETVA